jgi:hypothetical protein
MSVTIKEVAAYYGLSENAVRQAITRGYWKKEPRTTDGQGRTVLNEMPLKRPKPSTRFQKKEPELGAGMPPTIFNAIVHGVKDSGFMEFVNSPPELTKLDAALDWAAKGLSIFPIEEWLGLPLVDNWYSAASTDTAKIVGWWSEDFDADIAAVPDKSGHFVIMAIPEEGADIEELEAKFGELVPEHTIHCRLGATQYWFKGAAKTSHGAIGPGIHVLGRGQYVYLPPSLCAGAPSWRAKRD